MPLLGGRSFRLDDTPVRSPQWARAVFHHTRTIIVIAVLAVAAGVAATVLTHGTRQANPAPVVRLRLPAGNNPGFWGEAGAGGQDLNHWEPSTAVVPP